MSFFTLQWDEGRSAAWTPVIHFGVFGFRLELPRMLIFEGFSCWWHKWGLAGKSPILIPESGPSFFFAKSWFRFYLGVHAEKTCRVETMLKWLTLPTYERHLNCIWGGVSFNQLDMFKEWDGSINFLPEYFHLKCNWQCRYFIWK